MTTTTVTVAAEEVRKALRLYEELRQQGRVDEAEILLKLIAQAEVAGQESAFRGEDLTPEDIAALERSDAEIAAGRVVPHGVVQQGPAAVEAYLRQRDAGEVDPQTAAAVGAYRRDREARLRAAAEHA